MDALKLEAEVQAAYMEALKNGSKIVYRGRLNFYGYLKAGKSSLFRRLLGKAFKKNIKRTQGIAIQAVKVKENVWRKATIKAENVQKVFNKGVLVIHKQSKDKKEINEGNTSSEDEENSLSDKQAETEKESQRETPEREHQMDYSNQKTVSPEVDTSDIRQIVTLGQESTDDKEEEEEYIIFGWDFGGHAEYYATHNLLIEGDGVHLIVMDITKQFTSPVDCDDVDVIKSTPTTPAQFLCYWLNSILIKSKEAKPPVAIFLTHIDQIKETEDAGK